MADFDARQMLDCYLHDYFMKKNLPELAETFKNEANLEFDPNVPPANDVPEGFLLEWWKGSCDFASFREWLNQREKPQVLKPHKNIMILNQDNFSCIQKSTRSCWLIMLLVHFLENLIGHFKFDGEKGKAPLTSSPSSHEEGLLTHNLAKCTPTNHATASVQKPEPLSYAALRTANIGKFEKGDGSTSEATMTDDDTSGTRDCTSNIIAKLSSASEVPTTVHQMDSNNEK